MRTAAVNAATRNATQRLKVKVSYICRVARIYSKFGNAQRVQHSSSSNNNRVVAVRATHLQVGRGYHASSGGRSSSVPPLPQQPEVWKQESTQRYRKHNNSRAAVWYSEGTAALAAVGQLNRPF